MEYITETYITKSNIDKINKFCEKEFTEEDFSKHNISKFSCFFVQTVTFGNGYQADIKACSGDVDDTIWTEMVLFDENGNELCCTDVMDKINGSWEIEFDDDTYIVYVEEIEFDEFSWNEKAKTFDELNFIIDRKYIVPNFSEWLKNNFPKECEVLQTLSNGEFFGSGFENYVIQCMTDHSMGCGIYVDANTQLIRFNNATVV